MRLKQIRKILSQDFRYLDECSRCYVFSSKDNKYVLKIFKTPQEINQQFKKWGINLGKVEWSFKPGNAIDSAKIMFKNTQKSCKLAYKELRSQTGLLYIHLNKTQNLKIKTSIDNRYISLDATQFMLQYKVVTLEKVILRQIKKNQISESKAVLKGLINYINDLWNRGITEDTFNFHNNYGLRKDGKLLQIDVGEFYKGKLYIEFERKEQKLLKKESFQWLKRKSPTLSKYLTKEAKTHLFDI